MFGPFGEFIGFLGGDLDAAPSFRRHSARISFIAGDRHAATVTLWWIAQNLWNISVYISDARAQELPLVGGGEHDWTYLLDALNLLEKDLSIGRAVHLAAWFSSRCR